MSLLHIFSRYIPSRESHLEMSASVLIRLPNKQALLVKDPKFRVSRVLAQNAVAQLALDKLALEDPELKAKMEALAEEMEISRINSEMAPPPPPPHRFVSNPGYPNWRSRQYPNVGGQYYDYSPAFYPPPPFGMYPMQYAQSAPEDSEDHVYPYPGYDASEFYYYGAAPVLEPATSNLTDPSPSNGPAVMTPTGAPNWHHYPAYPAAWPYYAPYDMYYPEEEPTPTKSH